LFLHFLHAKGSHVFYRARKKEEFVANQQKCFLTGNLLTPSNLDLDGGVIRMEFFKWKDDWGSMINGAPKMLRFLRSSQSEQR
jgi:hypothetical protein